MDSVRPGEQAAARLRYRRALHLSRVPGADGDALDLLVLSLMSMQEEQLGRPEQALRLAASALGREELTPRVAAMFHLRTAPAHARLGRRAEALRALRTARELFAEGPSQAEPSWAWWLDRAELLGHHGLLHAALGELEQTAALLYEAAAPGDGPACRAVFATGSRTSWRGSAHGGRPTPAWRRSPPPTARSARPVPGPRRPTHCAWWSRAAAPRSLRDTARHLAVRHALGT